MRRWLWVMGVVVMVLGSAGPVTAQGSQDEACMFKGGHWDAEQGVCTVGATVELTSPYPMELIGMPYAEQAPDEFLAARRSEFLTMLIEFGPSPSPGPLVQDMQYTLFEGDAYTSLLYTVYEFTGGAHGSTTFHTFIFDHANMRVIGTSDLFTDQTAALEVVGALAREDLQSRLGEMLDEAWLNTGTEPTAENFQNVVLTPDALVFTISQYQVAPYAAGTFEIVVPLSAVADYLAIPVE